MGDFERKETTVKGRVGGEVAVGVAENRRQRQWGDEGRRLDQVFEYVRRRLIDLLI